MQLQISAEQRALLERNLTAAVSDMRVELRRTTTPAYHDRMQDEVGQLEDLLERVRALGAG